jgi:hypothetical protein
MDGTAAAPPEEVAFGGISRNESMNHDSVHVLFSVINGTNGCPCWHSANNSEPLTRDHGG